MNETLHEYVDSRGLQMQIDTVVGIIRGVKVLGLHSRNRRRYLPEALQTAMPLYEGAKVNINHAKGQPFGPRDYQDRIGVIRQIRFAPNEGLFADLYFNPKHSLAEQLVWDAQHAPENLGLSHNVQAQTRQHEGETLVESIAVVHSVDLVADPATTQGLFEEANPPLLVSPEPEQAFWSRLSVAEITTHRPELIPELVREHEDRVAKLETELDQLRAQAAIALRRALVSQLLEEAGLPQLPQSSGIITAHFIESLLKASDETTIRESIRDRVHLLREARSWNGRELVRAGQPRSRDQLSVDWHSSSTTTDDFVRAIT